MGVQLRIINEKNPYQIIALNSDFSIQKKFDINSFIDLSGLCYDSHLDQFWVVSAESQVLFRWNQSKGIIEQFDVLLKTPEGVAVDWDNNLIYVVSDSEAKLYIFKITDR